MKRTILLILFYLAFLNLNCANENETVEIRKYEPIPESYIFQLRQNAGDMNRFKFTISQHITERYIREASPLNISWQKKDPHNKNKTNYSIFPLLDFCLSYLVNRDSDQWEYNFSNLYSPYFLLNTSHYLLMNKMKYNQPSLNVAFFIKNNTDLFVFEKNNWAQISPGIGLRFFIGGFFGLTVEGGIENKSIYLFGEKEFINKSCYFFPLDYPLYLNNEK